MKKNTNDIFSIFILVILAIVLTFFLFFIVFKIIQQKRTALITETIQLNYINSEDSQIAMNDLTVQNIYNNVFPNSISEINISPAASDYNYYSRLYTDNLVNISDLYSYDDKSTMALKKTDISLITKTNINGIDYNTFAIDTLKQSYEKIFGNNTFNANNFSSTSYPNCNINEATYICDINSEEIVNTSVMHLLTKYAGYEMNDNQLSIYENIIYFNDTEHYFSTDINGINRVEDLSEIALSTNLDNIATVDLENYYKKYKHLFIIDDNDNYVWTSIEPVTQT